MAVRKVAVTLPEELYDLVERARKIEHRSRSEMIQEAIRTHFGEATYQPSDEEQRLLQAALDEDIAHPLEARRWTEVRAELWGEEVELVLTRRAMADLQEAHVRYSEVGEDLGNVFAEAVEGVLERLALFPRSGTPVEHVADVRRARMRRFPYGVFYRIGDSGDMRILRVLHHRREREAALSATWP